MNLRDYQHNAVEAALAELATKRSALCVLPTGTGKTIILAHIIKRWSGRVLVVAHREELIRQAASKITAVTGHPCDIEMASEHSDLHMFNRSKVVVASKDSLHERRLSKWKPDEFSLVVTDEAHHAIASSYRRIYNYFAAAKHLGVTATPDRTDERALGQVFESVAFNYEIPDAINDGWLVPILQRSIHVANLDFAGVKSTAGDLNQKQLAEIMENERMLHEVITPTLRLAKWRKVLMFCASVKHAERAAEILNRHQPNSARWVCGETPKDERANTLRDYSASRFQFLCNVGVFTEGFDEPTIDMVVVARPTESRSLYAQMVGRGTRPLAGILDSDCGSNIGISDSFTDIAARRRSAIARSAKPNLEVIDFEGNAGKHKLVCVADILGGEYDEEVIQRVREQTVKLSPAMPVDTQAALREAAVKIKDEHDAAKRALIVANKVEFTSTTIDPFDILALEPARERGWDTGKPATDKQVKTLANFGIEAESMSRAKASQLIGECFNRRASGKCTFKQARMLQKFGYKTDVSFESATAILNECFSARMKGNVAA